MRMRVVRCESRARPDRPIMKGFLRRPSVPRGPRREGRIHCPPVVQFKAVQEMGLVVPHVQCPSSFTERVRPAESLL